MKTEWKRIGSGTKLHAITPGWVYAICGIGGELREAQKNDTKCKSCEIQLKRYGPKQRL